MQRRETRSRRSGCSAPRAAKKRVREPVCCRGGEAARQPIRGRVGTNAAQQPPTSAAAAAAAAGARAAAAVDRRLPRGRGRPHLTHLRRSHGALSERQVEEAGPRAQPGYQYESIIHQRIHVAVVRPPPPPRASAAGASASSHHLHTNAAEVVPRAGGGHVRPASPHHHTMEQEERRWWRGGRR